MDKVAEGEGVQSRSPTAAPSYAVQFFLIPLAVVAVAVALYVGFRSLVTEERTAEEYLAVIQSGGVTDRWTAAYELSRLMADPGESADPELGPALVETFRWSMGDTSDGWCGLSACPPVRRYLALAVGRLSAPLPPDAIPALREALGDSDSETVINAIWALGSVGDRSVVPDLERMYGSTDAGVRKITVYAMGALPGDAQVRVLETALNDPVPDVQWNAAVALAVRRSREGLPVLRRMLDREYVEGTVTRATGPNDDVDPVADVMVTALQALASLGDVTMRDEVERLSTNAPNLRVRQAAMETLKALGPA